MDLGITLVSTPGERLRDNKNQFLLKAMNLYRFRQTLNATSSGRYKKKVQTFRDNIMKLI